MFYKAFFSLKKYFWRYQLSEKSTLLILFSLSVIEEFKEMADGSTGNNKVYFPWEENFLVRLREAGHSWDQIHVRFNKAVPENRQRSKAGVKSKYYDLILEKSSTGNKVNTLSFSVYVITNKTIGRGT